MPTQIQNLTPHTINVWDRPGGHRTDLPPSGVVARVTVTRVARGEAGGLPVSSVEFGAVIGLPAPVEGTILVVSAIVAGHPEVTGSTRTDIYSPGELIRGSDGQPVGCLGLTESRRRRLTMEEEGK